jgi:GT2 family glycosyltransferase
MDLSVIVVSYNTRQLLDECLTSLAEAEAPAAGMEVIVVDNGSDDGSAKMVATKYPQVRLIASNINRGFSAANNQGSAVARGDYLLFLNSDTRVSRRALVEPLAYLHNHSDVGAITVRLVYPTGERDPDNHRGFPTPLNALYHFSGLSRLVPNNPHFNGYFRSFEDFSHTHPVPVIAGSFMMMPKRLDRQLGGWDESYFFYGEDIDYCYRIWEAGLAARSSTIPMSKCCTIKGPAQDCEKSRPTSPGRPKRRASRWLRNQSAPCNFSIASFTVTNIPVS